MGNKKIFISVPMAGRTIEEIKKDIDEGKEAFLEKHLWDGCNYTFVDNLDAEVDPPNPIKYLSIAISKMADCDDVIFVGDWQNRKGCIVEYLVYSLYLKH